MDRRFSFQEITKSEIKQEILNLDSSKACQPSGLPTKIIKANSDIFTEVIHQELSRGLEVGNSLCTIRLANVTPVYKKGSGSEKGTYRPVNILSTGELSQKFTKPRINGPNAVFGIVGKII